MQKERHSSSAKLQMPCGGVIDTSRLRSAGVLTPTELEFCRANHVALSYDPVQIGWVPATAVDDFDSPLGHRARSSQAPRILAKGGVKHNAIAPEYALRAWHESDAATLQALLDDPEIWTWLPETYPAPLTLGAAAALIEISNASNHHQVCAVLRNDDIIGQLRLEYDVDPQDPGVAEISYWLGRPFWGKGIGSDIVRLFTARSFADNPGIRSIVARVHNDNAASLRILKKLGYAVQGPDPKDPAWTRLCCRRS